MIETITHKEVEQTLIGLLFHSKSAAEFLCLKLYEEDFTIQDHKDIFKAAKMFVDQGKYFDMVLLNDYMGYRLYDIILECGIYGICDSVIKEYINRIKELKIDRHKKIMLESDSSPETIKTELDILEREKVTHYQENEIDSELVIKYFRGNYQQQYMPGFHKLSENFNIELGQLGIISGIPSHGKTTFLNQVVLNIINKYSVDIAVCSPESLPIENHIAELIKLDIGMINITNAEIEKCENKIRERIQFVDFDIQHRTIENIIGSLTDNIKILVIDPWNELYLRNELSISDTDYIGERLQFIKNEAKKRNICIIIVAHPTKIGRDKEGNQLKPRPYDIFGSSNFANKADFILIIWRETNFTELYISKLRYSRNGKMGEVIKFQFKENKFYEV